jgi:hypothetical protein
MKRVRLATLCVGAALVVGAMVASTASATPKTLTLTEGLESKVPLLPGTAMYFESGNGNEIYLGEGNPVACGVVMAGTLETNEQTSDTIGITSNTQDFPCSASTVAVGTFTGETPLHLPWTVSIGANLKVKMKGTPKAGYAMFFTGGTCDYEAATVKGLVTGLGPGGLEVQFEQKLKRGKASSKLCPKTALLQEQHGVGPGPATSAFGYFVS